MWKPTDPLVMTSEQRRTLEAWVHARTTPQRVVLRSRICLLAADGKSNNAIARQLGTSRPTVILWRNRFKKEGPPGLAEDAPHGPSPQRLHAAKIKEIVERTLQQHLPMQLIGVPERWPKNSESVIPPSRGFGMRTACNLTA